MHDDTEISSAEVALTEDAAAPGLSPDAQLVAEHLDVAFYLDQIAAPGRPADPVAHYLETGAALGLDPREDFSTRFYLDRSPDVVQAGANAFVHYLRWGRTEGRLPHPAFLPGTPDPQEDGPDITLLRQHFDIEYYESQASHVGPCHIDAARHYFHFGWKQGLDPSPQFSTAFYLQANADVQGSGINPFLHYLRWGRNEGRRGLEHEIRLQRHPDQAAQHRLIATVFDTGFYIAQHPALQTNDADPILHYMSVGWRMDLDPNPGFSTRFYVAHQGGRPFEGGNPLSDYLLSGRAKGSLPRPLHPVLRPTETRFRVFEQKAILKDHFDRQFYADISPDLRAGNVDMLEHYILFGCREGRDPARWFETRFYLENYPRVRDYAIDPLTHYLIWGRDHGMRPNPSVMPDAAMVQAVPQGGSGGGASIVKDRMLTEILRDANAATRDVAPAPGYAPQALDLHWVIPNFGVGGGGHMTIFRMVHWLEYFGHRCTIWVKGLGAEPTDAAYERVVKHYQFVKAGIRALDDSLFDTQGDILFATSWDTARTVADARGFKRGCYFVQDYEPLFHARGSRAILAEATYDLGLAAICASPWLRHLIETRHNGWARHFFLSYDREFYYPPATPLRDNPVPRIALYGRIGTERRCVELALLALEDLARRGARFHVDIFGSDGDFSGLPCAMTNHGILSSDELGRLYRGCDLGICFSGTNYSLVPQEMMACGLPVVELDVESARFSIPAEAATFAPPDPAAIADALEHLLANPQARSDQAARGMAWASQHDWEGAARVIEAALLEDLGAGPWQALAAPALHKATGPRASVLIPTWNGGAIYHDLLDRLARQKTDFDFELVVVDSGSRDDTVAVSRAVPFARVIEIDKSEFQHGRTRNFAASQARGDYLLFLTQDALPADDFWLYNFVAQMDRFPQAAGAFGKHFAHRNASSYTRMEMRNHFNGFNAHPLLLNKHTDITRWNAGDRGFHQLLHFFSDNNSCLRRSAWEQMPYPEVDYGEDQLWAWQAVKRGWSKLYCPQAVVYHSHDYGYDETLERAEVEAWFFAKYFGYDLTVPDIAREHAMRVAAAERFGRQHGVPLAEIEHKKSIGLAQLEGWKLGKRRADAETPDR